MTRQISEISDRRYCTVDEKCRMYDVGIVVVEIWLLGVSKLDVVGLRAEIVRALIDSNCVCAPNPQCNIFTRR